MVFLPASHAPKKDAPGARFPDLRIAAAHRLPGSSPVTS
jgi:hypothetical protein